MRSCSPPLGIFFGDHLTPLFGEQGRASDLSPVRGRITSKRATLFAPTEAAGSPNQEHTGRVTPSEGVHCGPPRLRHEKSPLNFEAFNGPTLAREIGRRRILHRANLLQCNKEIWVRRARRRGSSPAPSQRQCRRRARRAAVRRQSQVGREWSRRSGFRVSTSRLSGRRPWR